MDIRVTQMLCSRLCHDLVGASGAINAGVELMAEMGGAGDDPGDALTLIGNSGRQLARRLAFFRMAFGSGGGRTGAPLADARTLFADYLSEAGTTLDWPQAFDGVDPALLDQETARLVLNMALLGYECLVRGGEVQVRLARLDGRLGAAVLARGGGATLKAETKDALSAAFPVDRLTPHTVQAHFTGCLADRLGASLEADVGDSDVHLAVIL